MNKITIGRLILCMLATLIAGEAISQPTNVWATQFMNNTGDVCQSSTIAVDDRGFVYTAGYYKGIVDFDPGPGVFNLVATDTPHIFVCKQTAAGNLVWAKDYGSGAARGITLDYAGIPVVTGYFTGEADFDPDPRTQHVVRAIKKDIFVMKLTTNGDLQWVNTYVGKLDDAGQSVVTGGDGLIYVTGSFNQQVDFNPNSTSANYATLRTTGLNDLDIFVLKLLPNGDFVWAVNMGSAANDQGNSIAIGLENDLIVGGYFSSTADFDPTSWGNAYLSSIGGLDIFVMRIRENNGNLFWVRSWGSEKDDVANALVCDNDRNICVTGSFHATVNFGSTPLTAALVDAFVMKITAQGNDVWAKQLGGDGNDAGYSISVDSTGAVFTTGGFEVEADFDPSPTANFLLTSNGGKDAFISKLSAAGNFVWAIPFAGTLFEQGYDIATPPGGYIYSTGNFGDAVDFDPSPSSTVFLYRGAMYVSKLRDTSLCPPVLARFRALNANASGQVNICRGGPVVFVNQSTGNPTSINWSFPGGTPSSSTQYNPPTIYYMATGVYPVTLTVANACGSSSTTTIASYVNVRDKPTANFSATVCGGVVNFIDLSTGSPSAWAWSFSGGNPSTSALQNPVVTFLPNQNYTVTLTVSNVCGSASYSNVVQLH